MGKLDGKIAVITGAGSGMGRAMAKRFSSEGAKIVALDYNGDSAGVTAKLVSDAGGECIGLQSDVTIPADLDAATKAAVDTYGGIDILCNNAGVLNVGPFADLEWDTWDRVFAVNAKAVAMFSQKVFPEIAKRGGGAIINIASEAGLVAGAGGVAYTASKHACVGVTKALALELGPLGIRVNAICPGGVKTAMTGGFDGTDDFVRAKQIMPRWADADEIATVAVFLACQDSSFITGVPMPVDGGWAAI